MRLFIICYLSTALGFFFEEIRTARPGMSRDGVLSKVSGTVDSWPVFILAEFFVALLWPLWVVITVIAVAQDFLERRRGE